MSEPLTATAKLRFDYTVRNLNHKLDVYMAYNDVLGQHQMVDRDGLTTVLWTLGAQYLWDKVRVVYPAADLPSPAQLSLFHRSGTLWQLIDVAALTGIGSSGSSTKLAGQATWIVRSTNFKFIRFILLESVHDYTGHYPNGLGYGTVTDNITKMLNGTDVDPSAPYRWVKNRSDHFIAATGAIAGLTMDSNDRLRRARGLM